MDINDFDTLIKTLAIIYPIRSKLLAKLRESKNLNIKRNYNLSNKINDYKVLCREIQQEEFIWKYIGEQGRAPETPTFEQQWKVLHRSIIHCKDLHEETTK